MLRQLELKVGIQHGTQSAERLIGSLVDIIKTDRHYRARGKSLLIRDIGCSGALAQNRHTVKSAGRKSVVAIHLKGASNNWIETGYGSADAKGRIHQSIGAGSDSSRSGGSAAGTSPNRS